MTAAVGCDRDLDLHLLALDALGQVGPDRAKQRGDVDGVHLGGLLLRVEPRQPQQIAHQALHPSGVAIDHFEKLPPLLGFDRIVHQRFDVAAHRRQRRAQLVRHVRHEIAPHAIDPAQIADVVQHEHGAATFGARGCGLRAEDTRTAGDAHRVERHFDRRPVLPFQRGAQLADDAGLAHSLDVVAPKQIVFEVQHAPRGVVRETQPPVAVHDEHAFDHAREDGRHARAIGLELARRGATPAPSRRSRVSHGRACGRASWPFRCGVPPVRQTPRRQDRGWTSNSVTVRRACSRTAAR